MEIRLQDSFSCKNMLASVIVVLTFLRTGICSTDPCIGPSLLGDTRRTTTEDPGTCGGLCDNNINEETWYRLDVSNSGARMPESSVDVWHCGTYIPIWLNGAHPTEDNVGPLTIPVCAQLRTGGTNCEWQSDIKVKYCYDGVQYFVYKLKQAPFCNMAYCAGNGINCGDSASWNDVNKTCTRPATPTLDVNPTLTGPYISKTNPVIDDKGKPFTATMFSMKCTLNYVKKAIDDGARYDVIFQSNNKVVYTFTLRSTDTPEVEMSETYLVGSAGQTVTCKVASYWQSQFPIRSSYRVSNSYKFDIYFLDESNTRRNSLTISESTPKKINVQTSFRITTPWCVNLPEGSLCYPYYTFLLTSSSLRVSVCTFRLANDTLTSGDIWVSSVPDIPAYAKSGYIYFQTDNSVQAESSIFGSFRSDTVPVTISDPTPWLHCDSTGDPHITPFGRTSTYHVYLTDDLVLLEVPSKNIQVHVRLYQCGSTVTCNCGVIAREGNNVLGINSCGSSTLIERYLYDETNPGGTIRYQGGYQWIITLPSGLSITADVSGQYVGLNVNGNGVDPYRGLCVGSLPSQCYNCECSQECDTNFRVSGSNSLFSYSRNNPPPCLQTKPPIVPQCECLNGASSRICTKPDNQDLAASTLDTSICKTSSSSIGKKRRSISDSQKVTFHKRPERSSLNPQWPTASGITEKNAIAACNSSISLSNVYLLCVSELQLNVTPIIQTCVLDIQLSDDIDFWPTLLATQMEIRCKYAIEAISENDTDIAVLQAYVENVCPRQCSQKGTCKNSKCTCDTGYMSDDCSVQQGQVPQVKNLTSATCDVRAETADDMPCRAVQLQAIGISSGSLTCKITDATKTKVLSLDKALSVSGNMVTCYVPLVPVTPDITFNETVTNYSVYVSISNNVTSMKFSNEMEFIIFDGICVSCDVSSGCKNQPTGCSILGRCYKDGAVMYCGKNNTDPRVCNPAVSNTKWLPINAQEAGRGSTTCSSSRPSAGAAILLLSYVFSKLFKESHMQPK